MSKTVRIDLKVPTRWGELTRDQLVFTADTLRLSLTREEMLLTLFFGLTGARLERTGDVMTLHHNGSKAPIDVATLTVLCDRMAWILDTKPEEVANPSKADSYLRDMCFGDWFVADTQFRLFAQDLDTTRFRIILPRIGEEARPVDDGEATAYLWWWNSLMDVFAKAYPNVFERQEGGDGTGYNPFKAIQDIHLMLNDDRPQDNAAIDQAPVHDVLSALDSRIAKLRMRAETMKGGRP